MAVITKRISFMINIKLTLVYAEYCTEYNAFIQQYGKDNYN